MNNELLKPTQILFSSRKTISLVVKANGDFIVKAPKRCSQYKINEFITKKAEWIIKKRTEQLDNVFQPLNFDKNESILLLGKEFEIILSNGSRVKLNNNQILLPKINSKLKFINFLKKYAQRYINDRLSLICSLFNFEYSNFKIKKPTSKNEVGFTINIEKSVNLNNPVKLIFLLTPLDTCKLVIKELSNRADLGVVDNKVLIAVDILTNR